MNDQQSQQAELDLRSYLRPIWRRKWVILAIVVVATAATYFVSSRQRKTYAASTKVYVEVANPAVSVTTGSGSYGSIGSQSPPTSQAIADVAQLVTQQSVTNQVARTLGVPVSSAESVTATPGSNSDFVTVTATSHSPVLAARLANAYVSAFLNSRARAVADEALGYQSAAQATLNGLPSDNNSPSIASQRQDLLQAIQIYKQIALSPSPGARQVDPAVVPRQPASPKPMRDAIFGGVVGLFLGVIVAFCLELLDRRLVRVSSIESIYSQPVLAVLPHVGDPAPLVEGQRAIVPAQFLEELRTLRVMLRLGGDSEPPRTIMVTSTFPREGKSTVTRDLALVYAEARERVLVIDGDLRRPGLERLFGVAAEEGLVQVLQGKASLSDVTQRAIVPAHIAEPSPNGHGPALANGHSAIRGSVDVLTHGDRVENPLTLLSSERMHALLEEASRAYDVVLLDTPPVLTVADAVPLMKVVDSVLLVARLGQTTRHAADRFNELLDRLSDVKFSGVIANDRRERFDDEGYGSYSRYGYGYYYGAKRSERKQKSTTAASS